MYLTAVGEAQTKAQTRKTASCSPYKIFTLSALRKTMKICASGDCVLDIL